MKRIVLLDIDGTLLGPGYKTNSKMLGSLIKECKLQGTIFALNSNRSLNDLLPVYRKFGLNGFIIGENGAFSFSPGRKIKTFINPKFINNLKKKLPIILKANFSSNKLIFADTVNYLQSNNLNGSGTIFVANKFRKYTMSIFVGKIKSKKFIKNPNLAMLATKIINAEVKKLSSEYRASYSKISGNILILPKKCTKASTFKKVLQKSYRNFTTMMISDDETEQMISAVDKFCAVANAPAKVKSRAAYVSKYRYAKGVEEILKEKVLNH